jgi:hypothetical protein
MVVAVAQPNAVYDELSRSLWKGYNRLRRIQSQGSQLIGAECILEILRGLQVLVLQDTARWDLEAPLIYAWIWDPESLPTSETDSPHPQPSNLLKLHPPVLVDDEVFTTFRLAPQSSAFGAHKNPVERLIHGELVKCLSSHFSESTLRSPFLWDFAKFPMESEAGSGEDQEDHESERLEYHNLSALHPVDPESQTHWLFGPLVGGLPSRLSAINGLMRLSFPLRVPHSQQPPKMATLVLGLALDIKKKDRATRHAVCVWLRQLAEILTSEVARLYGFLQIQIQGRQAVAQNHPLKKDELHEEVDRLHWEIASLAERLRVASWTRPEEGGFKFWIAFRELEDQSFEGRLRYCLTELNSRGFQVLGKTPEHWRQEFERCLSSKLDTLREVFKREHPGALDIEREGQVQAYVAEGVKALNEIFAGKSNMREVSLAIFQQMEAISYPLQLTPGYSVMALGHPEIVKQWLNDPRARGFNDYPSSLLALEAKILPEEIYYSPIADGGVHFGVCGIDRIILGKCPAYELQEIIDESGPRLRALLMNIACKELKHDLGEAQAEKPELLWPQAIIGFRRLAYYFLPDPYDYYTKLVDDSALDTLGLPWDSRRDRWATLRALGPAEADQIKKLKHTLADGPCQTVAKDFLQLYLSSYQGTHSGEQLHRIRLRPFKSSPKWSLLVLVRERKHQLLAEDLLARFLAECDSVL